MIVKLDCTRSGFNAVYRGDSFKCAFITHSEQYSFGEVRQMKRHRLTDEIFVLICGRAVMVTYDEVKYETSALISGEAYCVPRGTWHYLAVSEDARLFVCERADTDADNTDSISVDYRI